MNLLYRFMVMLGVVLLAVGWVVVTVSGWLRQQLNQAPGSLGVAESG